MQFTGKICSNHLWWLSVDLFLFSTRFTENVTLELYIFFVLINAGPSSSPGVYGNFKKKKLYIWFISFYPARRSIIITREYEVYKKNNIITFSDVGQWQITTPYDWTWKLIFTYLLTTPILRSDVETILVRLVCV